jgi:chaperonin GroES
MTTATHAHTQLQPLSDRLLIQPIERQEATASGIFLPDTAKERPQQGRVLAAGPGRILDNGSRENMEVSAGQRVLFTQYAGTDFEMDGEKMLIISQRDVLAVIDQEEGV